MTFFKRILLIFIAERGSIHGGNELEMVLIVDGRHKRTVYKR
jgi:hypothetical protein